MKTQGNNPKSLWNMIPETKEEAAWLDGQLHGLTCHDPHCSYCQKMHDATAAGK